MQSCVQSLLNSISLGGKCFVRHGHTPKRPRRAGAKVLITKHPHAVELPEQMPEYLKSSTPMTEKDQHSQQPHKMHVVTRLNKMGKRTLQLLNSGCVIFPKDPPLILI